MKKFLGVISGVLLLILIIAQEPVTGAEDYKFKYDFQYLFNWVAAKMEIPVSSDKPQPVLKIFSKGEFQGVFQEKTGIKWDPAPPGFYWPPENALYMRSDVNESSDDVTPEEIIVHELVHYFQWNYRSFKIERGIGILASPWEDEARKIEALFRLNHNLIFRERDLERLIKP